ncbi:MAG: hypothetical protein ABI867_08150 [Kofleriaceae bacterium]
MIWIFAVVGVLQCGLAGRAYLLERREGLPRSSLRFGASLAIAVALLGVAVVAQLRPSGSAEAPAAPVAATIDAATRSKIDELKKVIGELQAQLETKQSELAKLDPSAPAPVAEPTTPSPWPMFVALALVLFGFGVMTLGDLSTLLPRRRKAEPAAEPAASSSPDVAPDEPADLPTLTKHVNAGRWKAGLACAHRIKIERLHKLEQLDLLFLRALCGVMIVAKPDGDAPAHQDRTDKLAAAKSDLASLLELAPHMAEARWLAGYVDAHSGAWQSALDAMRAAPIEGDSARNESVCLLMLAEQKLAAADTAGATALFDEVAALGVLGAQIPVAMVTHRMLAVREDIRAGKFTEAAEGIAAIRGIAGLEAEAAKAANIACDVYDVAIEYRSGRLDTTLAATTAFFTRWLPAKLPDVEDQVADEYLHPAVDKATLALPAELYRGMFFVEAVTRLARAKRGGLEAGEIDTIATGLLRALQFQPRHREVLAALAALYLTYRKDRTEKALAWLDAAITLGVRSPRARALLAELQRAERERKELLSMFRAASAKFLSDPAVGVAVRRALVEELGRFEEFRPVVLELQETGVLEAPPASAVTVAGLRERAAFVGNIATEVGRRGDPATVHKLVESSRELAALASNIDTSVTRITALERAVMEQLGRVVLR